MPRFRATPRDFLLGVEFAPPPRQLLGAQERNIVIVALPGGVRAPVQRRLHGRLGGGRRFQHAQCELQRDGLGVLIMGLACRVAERKIAEQKPRHRGVLDDVFGAAHHHGGNAVGLEVSSDQAYGLVANRTVRHQHRHIHLVSLAAREDFGRIGLDGDAMAAVGRRAEETRCYFSDSTLAREPLQLRQRKPGSAVVGRRVYAIIGDMRNPQVVRLRRIAIIDLVEFGAPIVFGAWALIALRRIEWRRRGDDGDARLAERLSQALERRIDIVRPAIGRGVTDRLIIFAGSRHILDRRVVVGREAKSVA
jgi:hypothetical protein